MLVTSLHNIIYTHSVRHIHRRFEMRNEKMWKPRVWRLHWDYITNLLISKIFFISFCFCTKTKHTEREREEKEKKKISSNTDFRNVLEQHKDSSHTRPRRINVTDLMCGQARTIHTNTHQTIKLILLASKLYTITLFIIQCNMQKQRWAKWIQSTKHPRKCIRAY